MKKLLFSSKLIFALIAFHISSNVEAQLSTCLDVDDIQKISNTHGNFSGGIPAGSHFGQSVEVIGDIDNDGVQDVAVGAFHDPTTAYNMGAVYILLMNADGTVKSDYKIYDGVPNFTPNFPTGVGYWHANFGRSVTGIGDLDNDGVEDIAVGADELSISGKSSKEGAVFIIFLNSNGSVKSYQQITNGIGGFTGSIDNFDNFGRAVSNVGDIDKDGIEDIMVGANHDDDGGTDRGSLYVLFLNTNGTVKGHQKISDLSGGFSGSLDDGDRLGSSIAPMGDLNNDGVLDVAVVANRDDDGHTDAGAVWVLFMNSNGTVSSESKISLTTGGFNGTVLTTENLAQSVSSLGDINIDGNEDLLVGSWIGDDGGTNRGAVWVLTMNSNGTVDEEYKISETSNTGSLLPLGNEDRFGTDVSALGDLNNDGYLDLIVGARNDDDGNYDAGAIYVVFTKDLCCESGCFSAKSYQKTSDRSGSFNTGELDNLDGLGQSLANIGDLDNDGFEDIAATAFRDDDGGSDRGAVYIFFMNSSGGYHNYEKISDTRGNFSGTLSNGDFFGRSVVGIGDLDNDGVEDIAVGADRNNGQRGAVWILFMNSNGTVKSEQRITTGVGDFTYSLSVGDNFGRSVASLGDVDGDGVNDIAVGANHINNGGSDVGAVFILFMNTDGTVKSHQEISNSAGSLGHTLNTGDRFGSGIAGLGDLNNDGVPDLAVGAQNNDAGGTDRGTVFILFLDPTGMVSSSTLIANGLNGFSGVIDANDAFGVDIATLGNFTACDAYLDIAIGAPFDDDGGSSAGAVYIVSLQSNGTVANDFKISNFSPLIGGALDAGDYFGLSITGIDDLNKDGFRDIVIGSRNDDDGGTDRGAFYTFFFDDECSLSERLGSNSFELEEDEEQLSNPYPNPSNGLINIPLQADVQNIAIEVYSIKGELIYQNNIYVDESSEIQLNLQKELSEGMYLMKVNQNNNITHTKLIIK